MNRSELRTELQATGFGNSTADVIRQNLWLDAALAWVWNARVQAGGAQIRWSFKIVDQASLAVVAGSAQPVMPTAFGDAEWIEDASGTKLAELDPETFDEEFAAGNASGRTGAPYAYKVVNRQVVLGPTPSSSQTFKWTYTRRASTLLADGVTVQGGSFQNDTDLPLWPSEHHLILVFHAALLGHAMASNPFATTFQGLRNDALDAMRADLEAEVAPGQTWGSGGSGSYTQGW